MGALSRVLRAQDAAQGPHDSGRGCAATDPQPSRHAFVNRGEPKRQTATPAGGAARAGGSVGRGEPASEGPWRPHAARAQALRPYSLIMRRAAKKVTRKYAPYTAKNAPAHARAMAPMSKCPNTATTSVTTTSAQHACATASRSGNRK